MHNEKLEKMYLNNKPRGLVLKVPVESPCSHNSRPPDSFMEGN